MSGSTKQNIVLKVDGFLLAFFLVILLCAQSFFQSGVQPVRARGEDTRPVAAAPLGAGVLPSVSLDLPSAPFLGEDVSFSVTFDNPGTTAADIGYGPFIDVVLDTTGPDGQLDGTPSGNEYDGLGTTKIEAEFMGSSIAASDFFTVPFDATGKATHPFLLDDTGTRILVDAPTGFGEGDTLVVVRLPFGSFAPDQPPATVDFIVDMNDKADVNEDLNIVARAGYEFGYTPLNDWCCGDSGDNTLTSWIPGAVQPVLFKVSKNYAGPELETATGPNFPRSFTLTVDVASGQTITNLDVTDELPPNMQYIGIDTGNTSAGYTIISEPDAVTPTSGGTLTLEYASVTGGSTTSDRKVTFTFYIPLMDSSGTSNVIDADSGASATSTNSPASSGTWTPIDGRDPTLATHGPQPVDGICEAPCGVELRDRSIAIQKSVGGTAAPGQTLTYTLTFETSDFFMFNGITIGDVLTDGQRLDTSFTPTLQIGGNPVIPLTNFVAANYDVNCYYTPAAGAGNGRECENTFPSNSGIPDQFGTTQLIFRVSDQIGGNGRMIGDCVNPGSGLTPTCPPGSADPTIGTIVFHTIIQQRFANNYPTGDFSVDQGDHLDNGVTVTGNVLNNISLLPTGTVSDGSSSSKAIGTGTLLKEIYSINGAAPANPVKIKPGDDVTYRLTYTMPTGDEEALRLDDYLPLPIFFVGDADANDVPNHTNGPAWSFNAAKSTGVSDVPAAGAAMFGPDDSFFAYSGITPTFDNDTVNNRLGFVYGNFDGSAESQYKADILFTIKVATEPFADKLYLTNQASAGEHSTANTPSTSNAIVSLILTEPVLVHKKGVVATNNPHATFSPATVGPVTFNAPGTGGARWSSTINSTNLANNPINSDITGVDAGDLVTFAIVIENQGSSAKGAFDLTILDTLPAMYDIPSGGAGLNLRITNGDNSTVFGYHQADGITAAVPGNLFTTGIRIDDPDPNNGACQAETVGPGKNIIIITYDLVVKPDVNPGLQENTATLVRYAGSDNGPNHIVGTAPTDKSGSTVVTGFNKSLVGTEVVSPTNDATHAVIGELVTYRMVITIPEGMVPNVQLVDTLDGGLAFVGVSSFNLSDTDLDRALPLDTGIYYSGSNVPVISNNGHKITFNLGDITNTDRDNGVAETITLDYNAVVLNIASNQNTPVTLLNNAAVYSWTGGQDTDNAGNVTVIESRVTTTKTVTPTTADAGDTVHYSVTLSDSTGSDTDAFDLDWADTVSAGLTYVPGTLAFGSCSATSISVDDSGSPNLKAFISNLAFGTSCVINFDARADYSVTPNQVISNIAITKWTSLNDSTAPHTYPRSSYNVDSTERSGAGGINDYTSQGNVDLTINNVTPVKEIRSTSEVNTSGSNVSVGEIVRYRTTIIVPEGDSPDFQVRDLLPGGMLFIDDGSATVAFVSRSAGSCSGSATMLSSTLGTIPWICGDESNVASITPVASLLASNNPASAVSNGTNSGQPFVNGDAPYFNLGDITVSDSDANAEFVILEYNALVVNVAVNVNNHTLDNTFDVYIGGIFKSRPANPLPANVVEPRLNIVKTAGDLTPSAGEIVSFTLTLDHDGLSTANAYDVLVLDDLPGNLTLDISSINVLPTGSGTVSGIDFATYTHDNHLEIRVASISLNAGISVTYKATVVGVPITNDASITWTSLPGPKGTQSNPTGSATSGASGTDIGERNGDGGTNSYSSTSTVILGNASRGMTKTMVADNFGPTTGTNVTIGEILTYQVVLTLPANTTDTAVITDTLDGGLGFVDCAENIAGGVGPGHMHDMIASSSNVSSTKLTFAADANGNLAASCTHGTVSGISNPLISASGGVITFDFGTVQNTGGAAETLTLTYRVVVLDIQSNVRSVSLSNNVKWTVNGASEASVRATPAVSVVESDLGLDKTISAPSVMPDTEVVYTLRVFQTGNSQLDAYDVVVADILPEHLVYVPGTFRFIPASGNIPTTLLDTGIDPATGRTLLSATWDTFPFGTESRLEFHAIVDPATPRGQTITNVANVEWTSLPGIPAAAAGQPVGVQSAYNSSSTERRYDPLHPADIYQVTAQAVLNIPFMPRTGFAPGVMTLLPEQPADLAYQDLGVLWLEIPKLGVKIPIVGAPQTDTGWDLTWLNREAGWLNGTAYPTRPGNSVLTAHVYLPNGQPGPFVDLHTLAWGDQIIVHTAGQRHIYEIRTLKQVLPDDISAFKHEKYPYLTLITCKEYDAKTNSYKFRFVVKAVLVKVEPE